MSELWEPPVAGSERDTFLGSLERQRATFAWKTGGLDAESLRKTIGASSISLGGLLKHMALVEDDVFSRRLHDRSLGGPWKVENWESDPNWEWNSAANDTPEELYALYQDAVVRSRTRLDEALGDGGLDQLTKFVWPDGAQARTTPKVMSASLFEAHRAHYDLVQFVGFRFHPWQLKQLL